MKKIVAAVCVALSCVVAFTFSGCFTILGIVEDVVNNEELFRPEFKVGNAGLQVTYNNADALRIADEQALAEQILADGTDSAAFTAQDEVIMQEWDYVCGQYYIACALSDVYMSNINYNLKADELYDVWNDMRLWLTEYESRIAQSPFRSIYFEGMTDAEIEHYLASSLNEEMIELDGQINDIAQEYYSLIYNPLGMGKKYELYAQYVELQNRYAQLAGYENYMEYAYSDIYCREYLPEDEWFSDFVAEYIVPLIYDVGAGGIGSENGDIRVVDYYNALYGTNMEYAEAYAQYIGGDFYTQFCNLFENGGNYFFTNDVNNSYNGAYTAYISAEISPVVYFGPDYQNCSTIIHEYGHYYDCLKNGDSLCSYDLAETHSQGDEALFMAWLNNYCDLEGAMKNYASTCASDWVSRTCTYIVLATIVDSFERMVYSNGLGGDMMGSALDVVCDKFGGKDYLELMLGVDIDYYVTSVVVESPAYYISYAVSAIVALELYCLAQTDLDAATESYLTLFDYDADSTFGEVVSYAGLSSPFDGNTFAKISYDLTH